ncbi:acyl carrier protein phosphodiesterase [Celerinatantimonas diazotrophica]|uniref:Acyl carrier protein phosphodiesterase n=1 Tax=Celerinatantimonas diazotrophica TaxID=412034 RepID=A0A4R1JLJ0_9GAMM|nr:ACP phosphodiesterase [Celerinatantimonas diazotrophica]TCK51925.1 acyl carrier protein phosphodiesterase [Celerinatantimonas diazotrophica]CAG9296378.1 Acyl carrier protein phosphodiesterase [Celerinatantimonas diazotrophica]
MNYLGHFYLAHISQTSYQGALLGDFVKGNRWHNYPHSEQIGILLHRALDSWIDQWTIEQGINALFKGALRRFAPIALDLYWDYQLASHWTRFQPTTIEQFAAQVYDSLSPQSMPPPAQRVAQNIIAHDALSNYQQPDFILSALKRISERMSNKLPYQPLSEALWQQQNVLQEKFEQLMHDLPILAEQWKMQVVNARL